jgi:hypothetical protein
LPTKPLRNRIVVEDADKLDLPGPHSPVIARYADVKLDLGAPPLRVGYFKYESNAGAGCTASGVVILQGQDIEKSPRNDALLAAQQDMTDCRGSSGFLVETNGQNLIEIDGGAAEQRSDPPRTFARLQGGSVQTVCSVEQHATYTPQSVKP